MVPWWLYISFLKYGYYYYFINRYLFLVSLYGGKWFDETATDVPRHWSDSDVWQLFSSSFFLIYSEFFLFLSWFLKKERKNVNLFFFHLLICIISIFCTEESVNKYWTAIMRLYYCTDASWVVIVDCVIPSCPSFFLHHFFNALLLRNTIMVIK